MRHRGPTRYGDFGENSVPLEQSRGYASLRVLVKEIVFESLGRVDGKDSEFDDAVLKEVVSAAIGPLLKKIVLAVLGIEEDWSRVRIRSESPISGVLQQKMREHAKAIVEEHVKANGLPALEGECNLKTLLGSIDHDLRAAVRDELRTRIKTIAKERVEAIPREVILPIVEQVMLESYPAIRRLEALRRLEGEGGGG